MASTLGGPKPEGSRVPLSEGPFALLLSPYVCLLVLDYLASHAEWSPREAATSLSTGINTFYRAVDRLEALGLVAIERAPGGKRARSAHVTVTGEQALAALRPLAALVSDSRAGLDWELTNRAPAKGSPRAGEILCRLIEDAQRRGALPDLARLDKDARKWGRAAEAGLAAALHAFLMGDHAGAIRCAEGAAADLQTEGNSRSYRKTLALLAAASEYAGNARVSIRRSIEVRRLAREAGDDAMEAEASLAIGFLKARRDQLPDAQREMRRALACAERGALMDQKPRILSNLFFVEFLLDPPSGRRAGDEALRVAREAGSRIAEARVQTNRALVLAWGGEGPAARKALREARRHLAGGGEEKGGAALEAWAALVEQVLASPTRPTSAELRKAVQGYLNRVAPAAAALHAADAAAVR